MVGTVVGISLTNSMAVFYNFIIVPINRESFIYSTKKKVVFNTNCSVYFKLSMVDYSLYDSL